MQKESSVPKDTFHVLLYVAQGCVSAVYNNNESVSNPSQNPNPKATSQKIIY